MRRAFVVRCPDCGEEKVGCCAECGCCLECGPCRCDPDDDGTVTLTLSLNEMVRVGEVADCERGALGYTYDPHACVEDRWTVWQRPNGRHRRIESMAEVPTDGWVVREDD